MTARDDLKADLDARHAEFVELCAELIRRPSENPPGDTTELFAFVADYLRGQGIAFETIAPQATMPNLVANFEGGAGPGPHLVLNGHLDVFPAGDRARWSADPFGGDVRDGRLYGRGANDMKAGVTASLVTYATLYRLREQLRGRLTLTLVSDEETFGPWGARWLVEHAPVLGDALLNGEPSTLQTVRFGEKGPCWVEIITETTGGHGGYTHSSANAVREMTRILTDLDELRDMDVPMPPEVRNALHRQLEMVDFGKAVGEVEEEARDLLAGRLAAQQHHVVVRAIEAGQHRGHQLAAEFRIVMGEAVETTAAIGDGHDIVDGLGGETVLAAILQTEDVAGEMEGLDLASSVAQHLAHANRARHDLVEELRRVAFRVDLLALGEAAARPAHGVAGLACERLRFAQREHGGREGAGGGGGGGLHRGFPRDACDGPSVPLAAATHHSGLNLRSIT
jgi:acetylornithine deacetylase/succinyl-diaminopimelate desuccinylase-like protein